MSIVVSHVMNFLSLLLVGVLFLALRKRFFQSLKEEEKEPTNLFKHLAIGLAVLVGVPFAALLLMVTLIGMPISLIAIAMYCILIYLSTIASAYYVGSWVMKEKEVNETILLIGSLFVLYIAKVLPVVGGFISLVSLLLGLGIYAKYMFQNGKEEK